MHTFRRLTASETRLFFREPIGVFFVLVFPPLLLVVLGAVPAFRDPSADLGGLRVIDLYAPIIVAMGIAMLALNGIPQSLATYREKGILRRMRVTPVRPSRLLGAQLAMCAAMSVLVMLVVQAISRVVFDVALPRQVGGYLLGYVLCTLAMLALGLLVAAVAPSGKGAGAIGSILFFPVLFFAGLWSPRATMPEVLRKISDLTPLGAGVQSLQDATAGHWPQLSHLGVMAGWMIVAGGLATRYFRWE